MMLLRALVAAVEQAGVERARFFAESGLDALPFDDMHARVSLDDYRSIVRTAIASSGDPALGLHMGERVYMASFDVLGHLTEHSTCLRDALQIATRYARIVCDGPELTFDEDADRATLRIGLPREELPEVMLAAEFSLTALLRLIQRFAGDDARARRVSFTYAAPAHRAEYTRCFSGREHFSEPFIGIEIERSWLDRAQLCRSTELRDLLQARAELLLAKYDQDSTAADRVKRWLATQSAQPTRPKMAEIARDLGMSARSLRRRLRDERAPFSDLVEEARALRAKRMLEDPRCSIQEAAYAMGFDTPAGFSRAFKRWTGMAPSAFRSAR